MAQGNVAKIAVLPREQTGQTRGTSCRYLGGIVISFGFDCEAIISYRYAIGRMPPIPDPDSPEEFEYSGWLSFYPFKTEVKENFPEAAPRTEIEWTLENKLPEYEQGNPASPGDGFRIANTPELLQQMNSPRDYSNISHLVHINYVRERYQKKMAYDEDEDDFVETSTVEISTSDLFWIYSQYLFIRASKQDCDRVHSRMRSMLVNSLRVDSLSFERDFFIWLLYKDYQSENINHNLGLRQIQSIQVEGSDGFGEQQEFSDLRSSSEAALLPLLEGNTPESIEATFLYQGSDLVVNISRNRIQVLASRGALQELSDLERMTFALSFVTEFTSLYDQWKHLAKEDKYPPVSFFKEIYRAAVEKGFETEGISQSLIEKYRQVREDG